MKNKQFTLSDQQLLEELMLCRRDVRGNKFLDKPVSDEVLDQILHAASIAPSVGFSQPWEFVIVRDLETRQRIAQNFEIENRKAEALFVDEKRRQYSQLKLEGILQAPVNIAVFYKPSPKPVLGQTSMEKMGEYSVVCAIQNMWLMSRALNIGLGWVSILDSESVKKTLNAPAENKLIAYLCLGHVSEFLDIPELETLKWAHKKSLDCVVYQECYNPSSDKLG